jgi:hypothetical protein
MVVHAERKVHITNKTEYAATFIKPPDAVRKDTGRRSQMRRILFDTDLQA